MNGYIDKIPAEQTHEMVQENEAFYWSRFKVLTTIPNGLLTRHKFFNI